MAQDMEPMEVDCIDSEFDNKENTFHHSNMLPCTEKGYEELDVSELNMKLRYSMTPAASPMSKSYTAYTDNRNLETDDSLNCNIENNLTRSLNSTITKHDGVIKTIKTLPLQSLPTDQLDTRNTLVLRPLDTTVTDPNNVTLTISEANEIDENLSLPSTSSTATHTPEATTPVNDGGSPIMRGLKSVLNMFRPSQSPIPPGDGDSNSLKPEGSPSLDPSSDDKPVAVASTPIATHRRKDGNTSKRSSPLKDSIVFNDDLEKELQWKDETTIIFSQEKIPIHKLFFQNVKPTDPVITNRNTNTEQVLVDNMNNTVEYMDISYYDSKTLSVAQNEDHIEVVIATESDGEFVDCETTLTNNESRVQDSESPPKHSLLGEEAPKLNMTNNFKENSEEKPKEEQQKPNTTAKEDSNSTISIIQELDSLLEGEYSKKDGNKMNITTVLEEVSEETDKQEKENIAESQLISNTTNLIVDILKTDFSGSEMNESAHIALETDNTKPFNHPEVTELCLESQSVVVIEQDLKPDNEIIAPNVETPADVPLPDEDDIDVNTNDILNATNTIINTPDVDETVETELKLTVAEHLEKSFISAKSQDDSKVIEKSNNVEDQIPNTTQVMNKINEITEPVTIIDDSPCMAINERITEVNILPDLINQTIPTIDEVPTLVVNDEDLPITEQIKDNNYTKLIESPPKQEPQNVALVKSPETQINAQTSGNDNQHLTVESELTTYVGVNTSGAVEQTVNNITFDVNKITSQDGDVHSTVTINDDTQDVVSSTGLVDNMKDITQEVSSSDNKNYVALDDNEKPTLLNNIKICSNIVVNTTVIMDNETTNPLNVTISDKHTSIQENEINSTVIIDDKNDNESKNADNSAVNVDTNHLVQENIEGDTAVEPNTIVSQPIVQTPENINDQPTTDIEIILSENNSPYVSVMAGIETEPKMEDNIETVNDTTRPEIPSSPPIVSKGYNFNFDEIDDPFATKVKIRTSPPPNTPSKDTDQGEFPKEFVELPKKAPINRRKSQPPERKRPLVNKKKFNTTIDCSSKSPTDKTKSENDTKNSEFKIENAESTTASNEQVLAEKIDAQPITENIQITASEENYVINMDEKPSCDISSTMNEIKTISSSEQSYFSAAGSSSESFISKNVFNLPEIDNSNFNPFATKSKMRESPPLVLEKNPFATKCKIRSSPDSSIVSMTEQKEKNKDDVEVTDKMDVEIMEKDAVDTSNVMSSSKASDEKDLTREVNTEDEDTEEGPFLEVEDAHDKTSILDKENLEFNSLPVPNDNNLESGEVFIDAEAFEFFLNQNKCNMVADSGKESLFLKFDPLFAKRISSDGVLTALNKVQKRQSTPTKARPCLRNEASPIAGPSNLNVTFESDMNISQESNDEANITVAKPTMIVTPAVNPVVTPRNKSITPNRSNRRSITFTSPAMAVIDRLISMSANNSLVDTTVTQPSRDQHEADSALTQLRELLAEKEIHVYNLRAESMLLKERLASMESQVKVLEDESQNRLKKINDLNSRLLEKTEINKRMAEVVEEYERTIASLIAETEQDKKRHAEERIQLIKERDEQTAHLASMEASFSDLHSKYEKSKQVILSCKANEDTYKKSINDFEESFKKMQYNYETLKQHATSKLNHANQELEAMNKAHEAEVLKLKALLKRKELHITSLEESLAQKTKANDELTAICDELINKVG